MRFGVACQVIALACYEKVLPENQRDMLGVICRGMAAVRALFMRTNPQGAVQTEADRLISYAWRT